MLTLLYGDWQLQRENENKRTLWYKKKSLYTLMHFLHWDLKIDFLALETIRWKGN